MAAPLPSSPFLPQATSSRRPHRKRASVSRLSSDTTATLPPYRSNNNSISGVLDEQSPRDQPPDYPDSAEEADEESETDDHITQLISPPVSPRPRRRKLFASCSSSRSGTGTGLGYQHRSRVGSLYADPRSQSDIFLDVRSNVFFLSFGAWTKLVLCNRESWSVLSLPSNSRIHSFSRLCRRSPR